MLLVALHSLQSGSSSLHVPLALHITFAGPEI